nr:copia protein [Tanacetum cinerariifolium]
AKWVFKNKKDERGIVIKNKARLDAQGYTQEEGIDYDEVFAHVARIEAIRLFLAYASFKDFVVYVKTDFLYGKIEEEVYVCQPPGFEDLNFPDRNGKAAKDEIGTSAHKLNVFAVKYNWCCSDSVKKKTVNREEQLQALVDRKKVIITEATIIRDLQLEDDEGVDCLPNAKIFEQLTLIGTMASAIIYLATNQKFNFYKYIFDNMVKNLESMNKFLMYPRNMKRVGKCFSGKETPLFPTMMVQAQEDMGEESLGEEDASKYGKNIADIDADKEITLVDETAEDQGRFDDQEMFDTWVLDDDEVVVEKAVAGKEVSVVEEVNAASITTPVSVAATTTTATTPTISMDEITLAKAMIEIKTSRPKAKGIVMQEPSETPTPKPIVSS